MAKNIRKQLKIIVCYDTLKNVSGGSGGDQLPKEVRPK